MSATNKGKIRIKNDFYPTPSYVVEELLKREVFSGDIWECACGEGHISKVLKDNFYSVYSSDLVDRGYGDIQDFLNYKICFFVSLLLFSLNSKLLSERRCFQLR